MLHVRPEPFSLDRAYALAMAAELAYEPDAAVERTVFDDWGFDHCQCFDSDDTQAFVASDHDVIIVAFRGTENALSDWLTDANFDMVKGPLGGRVHEGFYDGLSQIWQALHHAVIDCDPQQRKSLWLTGHSLGAALAALAAARWYEWGRHVSGVYNFGQPRSGDATFRRNFNFAMKASTFRFVNDNDLVTRVPPRALGFSHLGTLKYFTDAGSLESDASLWQMFLDRWTFRLEGLLDGAWEAAQDHSMIAYRKLVEAALGPALVNPFAEPAAAKDVLPMLVPEQKPMLLPRRRAA